MRTITVCGLKNSGTRKNKKWLCSKVTGLGGSSSIHFSI